MLEMGEKTLVVQHNAVIEARYKLTVEEQRLIKTLVSQIQASDEDFKTYEIRIADLANLLGISDTSYYDRVKKVTRKILGNVLSFTDESGNEVQTNWLSSAKYFKGKGTVALRFDPELKPYLLELKSLFTSYELWNILRLKGMYSIRIYELLKQYEKIGRREFTLERFKQTLKIDKEYQQYRDFKKFVLIPAEKEICERTDIRYTLIELKKGRKVVGLIFDIKQNKRLSPPAEIRPTKEAVETLPEGIAGLLVNIGISRSTAESLAAEYGEERIRAAIAYTEAEHKLGKVKNPTGFLIEAIKNNYRNIAGENRKKASQEARAKQEKAKRWEAVKASYKAARKEAFDDWYAKLREDEEAKLREDYVCSLPAVFKRFEGKGMVETMFLGHLESLMAFPALRAWVEERGQVPEFEKELRQEEILAVASTEPGAISPGTAA